jgi:hypothetical protein
VTVTNADELALERLRAKHPAWDIWHVRVVIGPHVWCCKPQGAPIATHHELSAQALDKWLEVQPCPV